MRLDKWLKISRLIKRRTVANEVCDQGRVLVNGRVARASSEVKPGDRLAVHFGHQTLDVEILTVPVVAPGARDAASLYRIVAATPVARPDPDFPLQGS
ncbi:MAG: RNA-binding S4 domain-containing protein [bacterium]|nr:RNA-binding S4 domain-containing protein [bacterium]